MNNFNGERLKLARIYRNMTASELAGENRCFSPSCPSIWKEWKQTKIRNRIYDNNNFAFSKRFLLYGWFG